MSNKKIKTGYVITQKIDGKYIFFSGQDVFNTRKGAITEISELEKNHPKESFRVKRVRYS